MYILCLNGGKLKSSLMCIDSTCIWILCSRMFARLCLCKGVLVNEKPGLWAVAGDQVILALHGVEMNKMRYVHCTYHMHRVHAAFC